MDKSTPIPYVTYSYLCFERNKRETSGVLVRREGLSGVKKLMFMSRWCGRVRGGRLLWGCELGQASG